MGLQVIELERTVIVKSMIDLDRGINPWGEIKYWLDLFLGSENEGYLLNAIDMMPGIWSAALLRLLNGINDKEAEVFSKKVVESGVKSLKSDGMILQVAKPHNLHVPTQGAPKQHLATTVAGSASAKMDRTLANARRQANSEELLGVIEGYFPNDASIVGMCRKS